MVRLHAAHVDRIHGLTQNDSLREGLDRLEAALSCPGEEPLLRVHAMVLADRLAGRGQAEDLTRLARMLRTRGGALGELAEEILEAVRQGSEAARGRLDRHANALQAEVGGRPVETWRAALAAEAWQGKGTPPGEQECAARVSHVSAAESCVTVVLGRALAKGMGIVTVVRDGKALALRGDSPAGQVGLEGPRVVRQCLGGPWLEGDVARLEVGGAQVWEAPLVFTAEERARGEAALLLRGKPVDGRACPEARGVSGRVACAWATGGGRP
jgi:hypothetical protein